MQIVDAQIHLWSSGQPNSSHWQVTSFTAQEALALMDQAGVEAAVIHLAPWDPNRHEVAAEAVAAYPDRFAMLAELPLSDPSSKDRMAQLRDAPGVLGLRYILIEEPARTWLRDGDFDWLWPAAEEAGMPVTLLATDALDEVGRIAEAHPGLRLTIDHLGGRGGLTKLKDHEAMVHMPQLLALAKHPNVAVKATGAPSYSAQGYPFPIMLSYVRQIFDAFGPERTFWGTDITKMKCSWADCITMFTDQPWLSGDDQRLVMGDAICAWWGWDRAG